MREDGQLTTQDYKDTGRIGGSWLPMAAIAGIALFALGYVGLRWEYYFGTKREEIRRSIYNESQAFVRGVNQEVAKFRVTYGEADPGMRDALKIEISQRVADLNPDKLTEPNRAFLTQIGVL